MTLERIVLAGIVGLLCGCSSAWKIPPAESADASVTVYRDDWGVPHIYAATEEMGFYGLGFAQAEDSLQKLLGAVYWSQGRRAELEGDAWLASDIEQRRWRHAIEGSEGFERFDPHLKKNYRYFIAGLQRFMTDHPDKVPAWAPDIDAGEFVAIIRAMFWTGYAAVEGPRECSKTGAVLQASVRQNVDNAQRGASNGWALAPARTADAASMLLADPHVELQSPAYYEFRMQAGELKSAGFALGPLLWQVHNRTVAWAMTTGSPDMWDCYAVEVDADHPRRYLFDGEWQEMVVHEETFFVRGGEPQTHTFEYTEHNGVLSPVVARDGNIAYVVSASQMHDAGLLDTEIDRMNHARSVPELRDAMMTLGMIPQNLIMADAAGNLLYLRAGKTPIRPDGFDWTGPVPGNSSATAWQGFYRIDQHVQVFNPPQEFIQNNNVAPDRLFAADNLNASDYPVSLFNDRSGRVTSRGLRSIDVLSTARAFTVGNGIEHAFDEKWITTDTWQHALRFMTERYPELFDNRDQQVRVFVQGLLDFNGFAAAESVDALRFYYWRRALGRVMSRPEFKKYGIFPWTEHLFSESFGRTLINQAQVAAKEMRDELGSIDVAMGEVFRVGRDDASWPLGGESINVEAIPDCLADISPLCERTMRAFSSAAPDEQGQRRALRGSNSMRLVVFTDPVQSYSLHVYGQSDKPGSPHYDDQSRLASERRFKPVYFNRDELEGHIQSVTVLKYGKEMKR